MADNTTINATTVAGGDAVRDLDRLGGGVKTTVAQIDFGGGSSNPEQLVSGANPFPVRLSGESADAFGHVVVAVRDNDVAVNFSIPGNLASLTTQTLTGSAGAVQNFGQSIFTTGSANPSTLLVSSTMLSVYEPGYETYAEFTAYWASSAAGTFQRIGLTDGVNGFFVSYEGTTWGIGLVNGGAVTLIPRASFNVDLLTGAAGSRFTLLGSPVAINPATQNVFRVRFGWTGSAPVIFEVQAPDGGWIAFHVIRQPNSATAPSIQNPQLPVSVWMSDNGSGLVMGSSCWAAGSSSVLNAANEPFTSSDRVVKTRGIVVGQTASGGYVNQQVDSNGATVLSRSGVTSVAELQEAQSQERPISAMLVGDPSGDFAGVNFVEKLIERGSGVEISVFVVNPPKADVNGAAILSDAPSPVQVNLSVGGTYLIDTSGYQSLQITTQTLAGTISATNDQRTYSSLTGLPLVIGGYVTAVAANLGYLFPCAARWLAITPTTAGTATIYLRSQPWNAAYTTSALANNLTQFAGTAALTGGVAGSIAVGANTAVGIAPTLNPLVHAGIDGAGLTRRVLTDINGRLQTQDGPGYDAEIVPELLGRILRALEIANEQRALVAAEHGVNLEDPSSRRFEEAAFNS